MATETISRTRARIVQSPERIKRTIVSMGSTAVEDKRTVALHEAKARDLQAKITALFNIEKVTSVVQLVHHCRLKPSPQDIRSCVEQLQTIEKEVISLETSQKQLSDLKDHMDDKKIERSELQMKQDVCSPSPLPLCLSLISLPLASPEAAPERTRKAGTCTKTC